jgi:virulence-associated protein VapD
MFEGLDIKEAAKAQAQDIIGIEPAQGLINPVLKWMINSIRNRKSLMETGGMKGIKVRPEDASWKELIEEEAGYGLDLLGGPLAMYHRILNDADENTTHPILRSLTLRGPFRLKSTFTYGVNVEESKAKLRSLKGQEALEKRNQAKREFISKLVESAATGDSSVRIKAERNLRDSEFTGSIKKAFDSDLGKLIFQLKVVKRKKELAGTSEEKDKLNEIIKRLNKAIQFKKIKQSPKDVAAFMLDEEAELP